MGYNFIYNMQALGNLKRKFSMSSGHLAKENPKSQEYTPVYIGLHLVQDSTELFIAPNNWKGRRRSNDCIT